MAPPRRQPVKVFLLLIGVIMCGGVWNFTRLQDKVGRMKDIQARKTTEEEEENPRTAAKPNKQTPPPTAPPPTTEEADVQLFIIWNGARKQRDRIFTDIEKKFKPFHAAEWRPPKKYYKEDLWRLYWGKGGMEKKGMDTKISQCGGHGSAWVILVIDENPVYKTIETAHGKDTVNENMHKAKYLYRKWSGGGYKVHGTYSTVESEHDSFVVFGKSATEILKEKGGRGGVSFDSDLPLVTDQTFGFRSWPSCERLYKALSLTAGPTSRVSPSLDRCEDLVGNGVKFTVSSSVPTEYDHTLNIKAAMAAVVHGKHVNSTTWAVEVGDIELLFSITG
eukprot:TRINITY_DN20232_c1_g1_i1.p1 TRINITY_DN20232_c1_g1~~TRINITY_DN20232_c1_g1_i1.p1  ORF type:complete len:355 (+),score=72.33 TRINITY_DN20232_c1_g1_i1:65-1066(+)